MAPPLSSLLPLLCILLAAGCTAPEAPSPAPPAASGTLVVANMSDHTASILDVADGRTAATLPTGQGPHEVAVTHDGRLAVVTNYGTQDEPGHTLTVIDVARAAVARTIDLGDYLRPHGIAVLPGDSLLAVTSEVRRAVVLVRLADGTVARTLATEQPASHMLALTADGNRLYTTNVVAGTVSALDLTGDAPPRILEVAPMVEGLGVTPGSGLVWVGSNTRKTVSVVDAARGVVVDSLTGFGFPYRIAVTPDEQLALISDPMKGEVRIVEVATRAPRAVVTIPADGVTEAAEFEGSPAPEGLALTPDGRTAFVTLQGRNQVARIDLATYAVTGYLDAGAWPDGIAYSPLSTTP